MRRETLWIAALLSTNIRETSADGCCFWPQSDDRCDVGCESIAESSNYCAGGVDECNVDCGAVWCYDGPQPSHEPTRSRAPTPEGGAWHEGTYTTGYWDCCKPSCSWSGKGDVDAPVRSCEAETGDVLSSPDVTSVCDGGTAASCADNQPWTYNDGVSLGFAAAAVGGITGLDGDTNCGQCYELVWTDDTHSWGGGAHASLVGRSHVIQVTNIGYDVTGDHSFDLQIPGAGQGIFDTGCAIQFPGYDSGDFDCDNNYGGCADNSGCDRLPDDLRSGCDWRYDDYLYNEGGTSNNPYVRFRRVRCPAELVAITGSTPNDDDDYPALNLDAYASDYDGGGGAYAPTYEPTKAAGDPTPEPTREPTRRPTYEPSTKAAGDPTPEPTREPTRRPTYEPTDGAPTACGDDGAWHKKNGPSKDCAWVSRDLGRCSAKGDESYAWQSCPATCGTCAYDCADGGDSSSWHKNGDETKDCAWASGYYYNRASVVGADGSYAWEGCPAATHVCYHAGCGDDSSWHKRGEPAKDCAWAAAATSRCIAVGDDGAYAFEACEGACFACAAARGGSCGDDAAFFKKGAPAKDCAWVARDFQRCTVKGDDETWAFQSCPDACDVC